MHEKKKFNILSKPPSSFLLPHQEMKGLCLCKGEKRRTHFLRMPPLWPDKCISSSQQHKGMTNCVWRTDSHQNFKQTQEGRWVSKQTRAHAMASSRRIHMPVRPLLAEIICIFLFAQIRWFTFIIKLSVFNMNIPDLQSHNDFLGYCFKDFSALVDSLQFCWNGFEISSNLRNLLILSLNIVKDVAVFLCCFAILPTLDVNNSDIYMYITVHMTILIYISLNIHLISSHI